MLTLAGTSPSRCSVRVGVTRRFRGCDGGRQDDVDAAPRRQRLALLGKAAGTDDKSGGIRCSRREVNRPSGPVDRLLLSARVGPDDDGSAGHGAAARVLDRPGQAGGGHRQREK